MSEPTTSTRKLGRRQFSLGTLLCVITVTTIVLTFYRHNHNMFGYYIAIGLGGFSWIAWLSSLAGAQTPLRYGMLGGTLCIGGVHSALWMMKLSQRGLHQEEPGVLGILIVGSLVAVNLCAILVRPAPTDIPESIGQTIRRRAAKQSLAILALLLFVSMWPIGNYSFSYSVYLLSLIIFVFALAPWLIAWRRRRLAGYQLPYTAADRFTYRLVIGSFLFAVVSALLAAVFATWVLKGWDRLGAFAIGLGAQALAGIVLLVSVFIQWYRDHWHWRPLAIALAYALLVTMGLLFFT